MKIATAVVMCCLVLPTTPASAQTCYTPISSWQVSYTLIGNSATNVCADGNGTCTTTQSATGTDVYTTALASCGLLQWGPTLVGTVTSASLNNVQQFACSTNPPAIETDT